MIEDYLSADMVDVFKLVGRATFGLLFLLHGLQKFGYLGGNVKPLTSLFGIAGVIEVIGGLFLMFGLFTRLTAAVTAIEMAVAWFYVHIGSWTSLVSLAAWNPFTNNGEAALLFFAGFLLILAADPGRFSVDEIAGLRRS